MWRRPSIWAAFALLAIIVSVFINQLPQITGQESDIMSQIDQMDPPFTVDVVGTPPAEVDQLPARIQRASTEAVSAETDSVWVMGRTVESDGLRNQVLNGIPVVFWHLTPEQFEAQAAAWQVQNASEAAGAGSRELTALFYPMKDTIYAHVLNSSENDVTPASALIASYGMIQRSGSVR